MKIPKNIEKIISGSEKINVEFKKNLHKQEIKETMVAFSNSYGGEIIIGVEEVIIENGYQTGNIVGINQRNIDEDKQLIYDLSLDTIPNINYSFIEYNTVDGNVIYVISVNESNEKPVCTKSGKYKIRGSKGNSAISPDSMRSIINNEKNRLLLFKAELMQNRDLANLIEYDLKKHDVTKSVYSLSRFKLASLLNILNNQSKFNNKYNIIIYELYHLLTIQNSILNNLPVYAIMSQGTFQTYVEAFFEITENVKSRSNEISQLIDDMLADIDNL